MARADHLPVPFILTRQRPEYKLSATAPRNLAPLLTGHLPPTEDAAPQTDSRADPTAPPSRAPRGVREGRRQRALVRGVALGVSFPYPDFISPCSRTAAKSQKGALV